MHARRLFATVACPILLAFLPQGARPDPAAAAPVAEHNVKAAFLCKFPAYVEWPASPAASPAPLVIGVLESPVIARELERISGELRIGGRAIEVRRLEPGGRLEGIHVLFVGGRDRARIDELLGPARLLPILTVTESSGALAAGSIINFTIEDERVRFEVSLPAAEQSGLQISSRLLAVARRVTRRPEG
jgi:hypothetical protein